MKVKSGNQTLESMSQAVWYNRWTLKKFKGYLQGEILEVGCGIGNFTGFLTKYGRLTAIDIDKDYVKEAKDKVGEKVRVGWGDIEQGEYFFNEEKFNTVICLNVLEHIKDDRKALRNIHKLLARKGTLILLVPAHQYLFNLIDQSIGHFRRYEKDDLVQMLEKAGFKIEKVTSLNLLGALGWFVAGKLFKDSEIGENKIKIFNSLAPLFFFLENFFEPPIGTSLLAIARRKK